MLIPNKIHFRAKNLTRDKEHFIIISLYQEATKKSKKMYASNNMKYKLIKLKEFSSFRKNIQYGQRFKHPSISYS